MARRTPEQNRAIYQRRSELARERGFSSLGEQRRAFAFAKKSQGFQGTQYGQASYTQYYGTPRANRAGDAERVRLFYAAFHDNPDDYSVRGPKARWFVEVEGIMTYDQWQEGYPRGVR